MGRDEGKLKDEKECQESQKKLKQRKLCLKLFRRLRRKKNSWMRENIGQRKIVRNQLKKEIEKKEGKYCKAEK